MSYEQSKKIRDDLESHVKKHGDELKKFPRGHMGLTPDHVKDSPEYRQAKANFDKSFSTLQQYNRIHTKKYKKEIAAERKNRFMKEEAPVNSTGPAVSGTTGEPPGKKSRLMDILRRRRLNESRYGYNHRLTPEQKAASEKAMQAAVDRIKNIKTHSDKPNHEYEAFKKKHDDNRKVGDQVMSKIRADMHKKSGDRF